MSAMDDRDHLSMDQLRVGHYIHLDLGWMEHPFAFNHFKIRSEDQIRTLRALGLPSIRFSPELSDVPAPPLEPVLVPPPVPAPVAPAPPSPAMQAKHELVSQMQRRRRDIERVEASFVQTALAIRDIEKNLYSRPATAVQDASRLVREISDTILSAPELAIHVMSDKAGGDELYFHSLNVAMLSLMMARDLKLPPDQVRALGMGALLHDVGLTDVPAKILMKTAPLNQAERSFYELHCQYGVTIGQRLRLPPPVLAIIREHHELYDGSGYPARLKGEAVSQLGRIVVITNYYDELCNPPLLADALTPYEALSQMFAKQRDKFDPVLLQLFIRCLGVYPPGTLVQLSNGDIGMVSTINHDKPMRPAVVVYDPVVPKAEAITLELSQQEDFSIVKALRPAAVPLNIYNYLSPRKRISYYFEPTEAPGSASPG